MAIGTTLKIAFDGNQVKRGLSDMKSGMKSLAKAAKIVTGAISAIGIAGKAAFIAFAVSSSKAAMKLESLTVAFEVLAGGADKAKTILEEIQKFGASTPFEQGDIKKSAQTLLAFGVEMKNVMPIIRMLGDVSMGNADKLQSLALVFGQISSGGRLTGGDLLQLINVGFNPLNQISQRTGKSISQLRDEMSKGLITTEMVEQAFIDATSAGGLYNGMLDKMSQTTEGKLSNMNDAIQEIKIAFGKGLNAGLKEGLDSINKILPKMIEPMQNFGQRMGDAIRAGISGNIEDLVFIGQAIGKIIGEGMDLALKATSRGLGEKLLDNLVIPAAMIDPKLGEFVAGRANEQRDAASSLLKMELQDMVDNMRETLFSITNPGNNPNRVIMNGNAYQPIPGGMQGADLWKDGQAYRLLERIANNTQPSPL
jgi:tape measure domain-containing protein